MCRAVCAHGSADEVIGHAIGAPEQDGRIRVPANLPADRAVMAADRGVVLPPAASRRRPGPEPPCGAGMAARGCGVAMEMTQQYLAGELSMLMERVQAVATTEAAGRDAWSLRQAAETGPIQALGCVTVRALALTERLCWDSLSRGDTAAFTRQAAAGAALREFGVCAGLLRDA